MNGHGAPFHALAFFLHSIFNGAQVWSRNKWDTRYLIGLRVCGFGCLGVWVGFSPAIVFLLF